MKSISKYIVMSLVLLLSAAGLRNVSAQTAFDHLEDIHLYKTLTNAGSYTDYKITLNTFVSATDNVEVKPVDLVLVLDYSSSMCAPDGSWVEVATGATMDILCPDMNWGKNNGKYSDMPCPFFNQQRKINIGGTEYDLMLYQHKKGDAGSRTVSHPLTSLPTNADNKWYIWKDDQWTEYTAFSASDKVYSKHRIDILRSASIDFVNEVAKNSSERLDHRVSIVKFCYNAVTETDLLSVNNSANVATLREKIVGGTYFHVTSGDNIIDQGTAHDRAIAATSQLFYSNTFNTDITSYTAGSFITTHGARADSKKVVVLFSDGVPYSKDGTSSTGRNTTASRAIKWSQELLKNKGMEVHSVGLLEGEADGWAQAKQEHFLQYMSSDYTGAQTDITKLDVTSTPVEGEYYTHVENGNISEIFKNIASHSTETAELNTENTAVIDMMSNSFSLPENFVAGDVTTYTMTCLGLNPDYDETEDPDDFKYLWSDDRTQTHKANQYYEPADADHQPQVTVDDASGKVLVTNFDYTHADDRTGATPLYGNWVGERFNDALQSQGYYGKKLVIEFNVKYTGEPGFNVPSNDIMSGIYLDRNKDGDFTDDEFIKAYNVPMEDFPALCIVKEGLKAGESAVFEVVGDGKTYKVILTGNGQTYSANDVAVKRGFYSAGDAKPAIAVIRELHTGEYKVKELGWSWAYSMTPYHTVAGDGYVHQTMAKPDSSVTPESIVSDWDATNKAVKYFIINDGMTLCYRFVNQALTGQPLHGEAVQKNVFGNGNESFVKDPDEDL